jgi:4-amino-4-deoxy-L-arabinose transferase-like glycosyltransferase
VAICAYHACSFCYHRFYQRFNIKAIVFTGEAVLRYGITNPGTGPCWLRWPIWASFVACIESFWYGIVLVFYYIVDEQPKMVVAVDMGVPDRLFAGVRGKTFSGRYFIRRSAWNISWNIIRNFVQTVVTMKKSILHSSSLWNTVFAFTMLVYAVGLFVPIMEPDAAVYAQVSMEMHDRGDYLSIYHKGVDWLDKPHFPFWMSALSYELFGVKTFAYKLPAVFFILLGALYTYLFGKKFYSALHGWLAVIVLITAEHIIISNQDVRAEPFMTGLMIMGLYHFVSVISAPVREARNLSIKKLSFHLIFGSLATAALIMTKGLFTMIPIASGIGLSLLYEKNWRAIFSRRWLIAAALIILFMTPALYGYYQQFDKHPEKTIFGEHNVSGVKFFLWTSQWGRFTNTGPIKGKGDITFFIHTMLWAFLPWAFAAFFAIFNKAKQLIKGITSGENYTFFGFITLFLIFSASRFQLSFYLNPLFPFLSILTVGVLLNQSNRILKIFSNIHFVLSCLLVVGLVLLHYIFMNRLPHIDSILIVLAGLTFAFIVFFRKQHYLQKIFFATALVVLSVNYYLNRDFYPELLTYQAESEAAYYLKQNKIDAKDVVFVGEMESVADVILHQPTKVVSIDDVTAHDVADKIVFTSPEGRAKINSMRLSYDFITEFDDYPVTRLTRKFLNKSTRENEVQTKYLLRVAAATDKPDVDVTRSLP